MKKRWLKKMAVGMLTLSMTISGIGTSFLQAGMITAMADTVEAGEALEDEAPEETETAEQEEEIAGDANVLADEEEETAEEESEEAAAGEETGEESTEAGTEEESGEAESEEITGEAGNLTEENGEAESEAEGTEAENPTEESTEAEDPSEEGTEAGNLTEESTESVNPSEESGEAEAENPTEESTEFVNPSEESGEAEAENPTEESTEAENPTEESTEVENPVEESTEAVKPAEESTEEAAEEESTEAVKPAEESTEAVNQSEESTAASEESTAAAEETTAAAEETTATAAETTAAAGQPTQAAQATEKTFTVTFEADGGYFGEDEKQDTLEIKVAEGKTLSELPEEPRSKDEKLVFAGWVLKEDLVAAEKKAAEEAKAAESARKAEEKALEEAAAAAEAEAEAERKAAKAAKTSGGRLENDLVGRRSAATEELSAGWGEEDDEEDYAEEVPAEAGIVEEDDGEAIPEDEAAEADEAEEELVPLTGEELLAYVVKEDVTFAAKWKLDSKLSISNRLMSDVDAVSIDTEGNPPTPMINWTYNSSLTGLYWKAAIYNGSTKIVESDYIPRGSNTSYSVLSLISKMSTSQKTSNLGYSRQARVTAYYLVSGSYTESVHVNKSFTLYDRLLGVKVAGDILSWSAHAAANSYKVWVYDSSHNLKNTFYTYDTSVDLRDHLSALSYGVYTIEVAALRGSTQITDPAYNSKVTYSNRTGLYVSGSDDYHDEISTASSETFNKLRFVFTDKNSVTHTYDMTVASAHTAEVDLDEVIYNSLTSIQRNNLQHTYFTYTVTAYRGSVQISETESGSDSHYFERDWEPKIITAPSGGGTYMAGSTIYFNVKYQAREPGNAIYWFEHSTNGSSWEDVGPLHEESLTESGTQVTLKCSIRPEDTDVPQGTGTHYWRFVFQDPINGEEIRSYSTTVNIKPHVSSVTLNKYSVIMLPGTTVELQAGVLPSNAYDQNIKWVNGNDSVTSIYVTGNKCTIGALAAGTSTITAYVMDGGKSARCEITVGKNVKGIQMGVTELDLYTGEGVQLSANVTPADALEKGITWSSNDASIASINTTGMVVGVAPGTAKITAKTVDGYFEGYVNVTVGRPIESVSISKTSASLIAGKSLPLQLTGEIQPADSLVKTMTWSSSDEKVAKVSGTGLVTAVGPGTATITVEATDKFGTKKATCKLTVTRPVTGVTLSKTSTTIAAGKSEKLTATVKPADASNKNVTWTSSNTAVATVAVDGTVKGVKAGTATITVKTKDGGKTATCKVTVTQPVTGVTLSKANTTIEVGKSEKLTATVKPADASNKNVTWTSSNTAVATVAADGTVKGVKAGTATITVKTKDGGKTATCKVTVGVAVTGVKLSKTSLSLAVGKTQKLAVTISPGNASNQAVTWTSSNNAVATVAADGTVKAVKAGSANITVTTKDGGKTATCKVTVPQPVTGVKVSKASTSLDVGKTFKVTATVSPANAANKNVTWKSSDTSVATVAADGTIRAVGAGTATITVTTRDGAKAASCKVTVKAPVMNGWVDIGSSRYYYKDGQPVKGFQKIGGKYYYFDPSTGAMKKGDFTVDRIPCHFDPVTGEGLHNGWLRIDGKDYWYEKGQRQGTKYDPNGVKYDGTVRGREIYDAASDGWYWLDAVYNGAKAVNKEVMMPYIYSNEAPGSTDGKWVRYDGGGAMIKGWYIDNAQNKTVYYDPITGAMAKGKVKIGNKTYEFNKITGALIGNR